VTVSRSLHTRGGDADAAARGVPHVSAPCSTCPDDGFEKSESWACCATKSSLLWAGLNTRKSSWAALRVANGLVTREHVAG
jgi:hypothetical protein